MKEAILREFTNLISELVDTPDIHLDKDKFEKWLKKAESITSLTKKLSENDFNWLDQEYRKWFNGNIKSKMDEIMKRFNEARKSAK